MKYFLRIAIVWLMLSGFIASNTAYASPLQGGGRCFIQVPYCIQDQFLQYWDAHGGLPVFGYPITAAQPELDENGNTYLTQWFERNRFELHPEKAAPYNILLGLLGNRLVENRRTEPQFNPNHPANDSSYSKFIQTGFGLRGKIKEYWEKNGGLAIYGYPISIEFTEKNPNDGKEYTVQYFERNRFEIHPEFVGTKYEILLGLLGNQILNGPYPRCIQNGDSFNVGENTYGAPSKAESQIVIDNFNARNEKLPYNYLPALDKLMNDNPCQGYQYRAGMTIFPQASATRLLWGDLQWIGKLSKPDQDAVNSQILRIRCDGDGLCIYLITSDKAFTPGAAGRGLQLNKPLDLNKVNWWGK